MNTETMAGTPRKKSPKTRRERERLAASRVAQTRPELIREAAALVTRTERVDWMIGLMLAGRFPWGMDRVLAPVWGCSEGAIRDYSGEAARSYRSRVGRLGIQAGEEFRALLLSQLAYIGTDALERTEEVVDNRGNVRTVKKPDHRTARQAVVDMAQLAGLSVQLHEVNVTTLTDEQIRAQLRAHGYEVRQLETTGEAVEAGAAGGKAPDDGTKP